MRIFFHLLLLTAIAGAARNAVAHGIPLAVDADGGNQLFSSALVTFDAEEGTFAPTPTDSPVALTTTAGFYPVFQGGIPAGTVLTVNASGSPAHANALAYWDGTSVLVAPTDVTISRSSFNIVVQPDDEFVAGGTLAAYSGLEGGHSSVTLALPLDAPTGLYAVGFQLSAPGFETSETFWALANHGVDPAQFEAGVAAIAAAVPEPSGILLGCIGCGAIVVRRRWRKVR